MHPEVQDNKPGKCPKCEMTLRPEFAALLMSISSIIVATNAVLLKKVEKDLISS